MARHVRKGDTVRVITGDDKGKTGQVLRVDLKAGKVLVQGVNRAFRHLRPSRQNPQGGRIQKEMPIALSNVQPVDAKTGLPTRVRFRVAADGSKERIAARSGETISVDKRKSD